MSADHEVEALKRGATVVTNVVFDQLVRQSRSDIYGRVGGGSSHIGAAEIPLPLFHKVLD